MPEINRSGGTNMNNDLLLRRIIQDSNIRSSEVRGTENTPQKAGGAVQSEFADLLKQELEKNSGLKFSKHAIERVSQRGIELGADTLGSVCEAVARAGAKGANEVAVINSKFAFIVSVPNKTVITALGAGEIAQNIFTNIDSAVLI